MTKEPTRKIILPEIERRKRKVLSDYAVTNISYRSLFDTTIKGYEYVTRYFLDYTGHDLMCYDVTQELINNYYLHLQKYHKATPINSYVSKVFPTILYGVEKGFIKEKTAFTYMVGLENIKDSIHRKS